MSKVKIVEVGPRDGLQNEKNILSTDKKIEFIKSLVECGLKNIEIGSFVSPEKVPQMSDSLLVAKGIINPFSYNVSLRFPVLVPNEKGMALAIEVGAKDVSVFAACSESFSKANINCSIEESFERFAPVMKLAKKHKIKVRGYLSVCFYCPYEGKVSSQAVVRLARRLIKMGCSEVSIGDTIGAATPKEVRRVVLDLKKYLPLNKIAMHFHDTRGTALANILESLHLGIRTFDSSLGGLGGCPYAPGAQGNVSTEDLVYMLHGMGYKTGISLEKLIDLNKWISKEMGKNLPSRVGKAGLFHTM